MRRLGRKILLAVGASEYSADAVREVAERPWPTETTVRVLSAVEAIGRLAVRRLAVGGLYGAVAELAPEATTGAGLPFGAAFWLVADEGAVPLLGLSKGPTEYPLGTHAYALASHFVYGLTAEAVRRALRGAL